MLRYLQMKSQATSRIARRDFLKLAGAAGVSGLSPVALVTHNPSVALIMDHENPLASGEAAKRAAVRLRQAFTARGIFCEIVQSIESMARPSLCVVVAGAESPLATGFPAGSVPASTESLRLSSGHLKQIPAVLISAIDARGFAYGLLELVERVQFDNDPLAAMHLTSAIDEKSANEVRGVGRYFCSEIEDKTWYYDKAFWTGYLDLLVASRFNRFTLAYGLEYDFPRGVTDDYFHFVYPYLVQVPGYPDVRVMHLAAPDGSRLATPAPISSEERDRNFAMLRHISTETSARGLDFHLGIWTHAYQWTDSPNAYHRVEGLTPDTHAKYCRDALAIILKECREIRGLTMRVHGESGIPEGSYQFWKIVFEAISGAGRQIEIDMHAKGVDQAMIDIALQTGMPVKLGAKFSAEHQSLGYHQADIRALEIPHANLTATESSLFKLSSGSRSFTRYGYADFLQQESRYRLLFRLWPGTQRHLLSVDPETIAGYARSASFCGASGLDLMEPLTFKGREGSGLPGGRCAYADTSLNPEADWKKYEYYYRVWGRKLYDPDADPEIWRRYLRSQFGAGAGATETALANASRILSLLTSAHLDSASNHDLWYEMPTNMPIVLGSEPSPYGDTPVPKCFGTVSPLDPQMFSTIVEYTKALLAQQPIAKYSPIAVAQWLDDCVADSLKALHSARRSVPSHSSREFRRIEEDVLIQTGLGTFFEHKLRSAVLYEIFLQTQNRESGKLALTEYQKAREAWAAMATRADRVYTADISYGNISKRRGHWSDRLPAIDTDLSAMQAKVQSTSGANGPVDAVAPAIQIVTGRSARSDVQCVHVSPGSFQSGRLLTLSLQTLSSAGGFAPASAQLYYRHVNQAVRWNSAEMSREGDQFRGAIPAEYTKSKFFLQYYFALEDGKGSAWMYPGFNKSLSNQPYFAISKMDA
jgi:hypothetical protein